MMARSASLNTSAAEITRLGCKSMRPCCCAKANARKTCAGATMMLGL